jgi:hypothetical protein
MERHSDLRARRAAPRENIRGAGPAMARHLDRHVGRLIVVAEQHDAADLGLSPHGGRSSAASVAGPTVDRLTHEST